MLRQNKGFTLIELIVVIGILSILVTIAFPQIKTYGKTHDKALMNNARKLWNDIRYIEYIRMTEGKPMRILLNGDHYIIAEGDKQIRIVYLDKGLKIFHNIEENDIMFSPSGAPSYGSAGTIKILNSKTKRYVQITILPGTGRILLKDKIFEGFTEDK